MWQCLDTKKLIATERYTSFRILKSQQVLCRNLDLQILGTLHSRSPDDAPAPRGSEIDQLKQDHFQISVAILTFTIELNKCLYNRNERKKKMPYKFCKKIKIISWYFLAETYESLMKFAAERD